MKSLVIGTQGAKVVSGPGTFVRYLSNAAETGTLDIEILFPHDPSNCEFRDHKSTRYSRFGRYIHEKFPGSWLLTAMALLCDVVASSYYGSPKRILFCDRFPSLFFVALAGMGERAIIMVNDDTRIENYHNEKKNPLFWLKPAFYGSALFYYLEWFLCKNSCLVVANSYFLKNKLAAEYALGDRRLFVLYKAVNLTQFTPSLRKDISPHRETTIVFLKNEWRRGGLDNLIKALSLLDSTIRPHLQVGGVSEERDIKEIKQIWSDAALEGRLEFLGMVPRNKVAEILRSADLIAIPSRLEALGVVFLEALACGVPALGTHTGGIPEVLAQGKAGYLCEACTPEAIAVELKRFLSNPVLREQKRLAGLQHVKHFSTERMYRELNSLFTPRSFKNVI